MHEIIGYLALAEMGLTESVGNSKLDVALYTERGGVRCVSLIIE
jgi:hypothetical protein